MKLQAPRGTRDIFGKDALSYQMVERAFMDLALVYGFQPIRTPTFEPTGTFKRSLGDSTDIVNKEMYTFLDRSETSLTLRPEGTAPVVRAMISNGLTREVPLKFYYLGSMFRYERPQKGRYREFFQLGVECLGPNDPKVDCEVMALGHHLFKKLKIEDKIQLEINSLGDEESRKSYKKKLFSYFSKFKSELSEDSQRRLTSNPLRILDSKDEKDQKFLTEVPSLADSLNDPSRKYFDKVLKSLDDLKIPYVINAKLVRGLDYYNHTIWEFTTTALGAQNAVLSGGRYDGLMKTMGGPSLPGVGFGGGIDRMVLLLEEGLSKTIPSVAVVAMAEEAQAEAFALLNELRYQDIPSVMFFSGQPGKQLKKANKKECWGALLIGEDELKNNSVSLKDFESGQQLSIPRDQIASDIKKRLTKFKEQTQKVEDC